MKTESLKKQIIKNLCITAFLAAAFSSIIYFYSSEKGSTEIKITKINNETSQINVELADLQSKTTEIKKYKEMWPTISEDKKNTSGIKADEVNAKLSALADKYGIANQTIKLSLPEMLKDGVFNCTTTSVTMSTVNITFTAVDDVKAIMFASEFLNSLKGYPVVTSFSINKKSDYTDKDLVEIFASKLARILC